MSKKPKKPPVSEVEAYGFIRDRLKNVGWDIRNPSGKNAGQVWTQNQCLAHEGLKSALKLDRPENIVKLGESQVWVLEAKASKGDLDKAIHEAKEQYCKKINEDPCPIEAVLATGVAGHEDSGYYVRTFYRKDGVWLPVTINGQVATGFLSPEDVRVILASKSPDISDYAPPELLFLNAAEKINAVLHVGGINKNDRAKVMAALLLAVLKEPAPQLDGTLDVLIKDINSRSESILYEHDKPEFARFIHIIPPVNRTNHIKYKAAIVKAIQELHNLNIRSAMNSRNDVLGQFYEVFLKYGNGAKEIGIVLTPRHITRFAVDAVGVSHKDLVLDLACGTGGFLVAAFDHVRKHHPAHLDKFKRYNLFGIEQESYVAILAIVNMIFRGDGNHNITEGNCFTTYLAKATEGNFPTARFVKSEPTTPQQAITRVLMNPPFALKESTDQEFHFVSRGLEFMEDGGILFALLPLDAMFGSREEKDWRKEELLTHHTLLAVVTLPHALFVPAALKQVCAIIVKKGHPHPKKQNVFWARVERDGHIVVKTKRLRASEFNPPRYEDNDIPKILPQLQNFIAHPDTVQVNIPKLCKTAPIDFDDPLLELLPEAYIESPVATAQELELEIDAMIRDTVAFLIRGRREDLAEEYEHDGDQSAENEADDESGED